MFYGEVLTGPRSGFLAMVTNGSIHFEIQPLGDPSLRELYQRSTAQNLADGHAAHLNASGTTDGLSSSWVRR